MSESTFSLKYLGPALDDGQIPVRDLAPALLALGDLFVEASELIYPDRDPVRLSISATERGSFAVDLALSMPPGAVAKLTDLLTSETANALANLDALVLGGAGIGGLIKLILFARNRTIAKQEETADGRIRVEFEDGTSVVATGKELDLYVSAAVRKPAREFVRPLEREGIDALEVRSGAGQSFRVESADVVAFDVPETTKRDLGSRSVEMTVEITSPVFIDGNKWRLSTGDGESFRAAIRDQRFLSQIEQGLKFGKGDMLRCQIEISQMQTTSGLRTTHTVEKVLEHIAADEQLTI